MQFLTLMKESAKELKKVQALAVTALLAALNTILGFLTFMIGNFIKVSWSFLTLSLAGMLYGPVVAAILGAMGDIINYMIKPMGPFFPGFTLNAIISGFIYGLFLYKKPITMKRIFLMKFIIVIIVDLCLSTTWLSMLYGQAFLVLLPMRALKSAIMLPVETIILYYVLTRLQVILGLKHSKTVK
jgi:ECF transporter S component (folate family)